jgi:hypothetical protein
VSGPDVLSESAKKLAALRDATRRFGAIHEDQLRQLKHWPLVMVRGCSQSTAQVDADARKVTFALVFSRLFPPNKKHFSRLAEAVKWLFGDEWSVEVRREGAQKPIFLAEGSAGERKEFPGADFSGGETVPTSWKLRLDPQTLR